MVTATSNYRMRMHALLLPQPTFNRMIVTTNPRLSIVRKCAYTCRFPMLSLVMVVYLREPQKARQLGSCSVCQFVYKLLTGHTHIHDTSTRASPFFVHS